MPRGDRTGPEGMGPRSGRGMGFCNGYGTPGFRNAEPGMGRGRGGAGFGAGRGWRNRYWATGLPGWARFGGGQADYADDPAAADGEPSFLRRQLTALQNQLDAVQRRLDGLAGRDGADSE